MNVYYNEFDKKKCAALSQLMKDGYISKGEIDDRSIRDVQPADLKEFEQCHFFAGIGLWAYALQCAGWGDRPVWTGSCPCQSYSVAGRRKGKADDRHLWPEWLRLIVERKPATIFGEQVSAAISYGWLDDVYQGLETLNYSVGSAVLPACSIGAPHRRDRLWFVANSNNGEIGAGQFIEEKEAIRSHGADEPCRIGEGYCSIGYSEHYGQYASEVAGGTDEAILNSTQGENIPGKFEGAGMPRELSSDAWQTGEWLACPDGKKRLIEPGIPLLVDGYPERMGIIHCAGDAIVSQLAAQFIKSFMEVDNEKLY